MNLGVLAARIHRSTAIYTNHTAAQANMYTPQSWPHAAASIPHIKSPIPQHSKTSIDLSGPGITYRNATDYQDRSIFWGTNPTNRDVTVLEFWCHGLNKIEQTAGADSMSSGTCANVFLAVSIQSSPMPRPKTKRTTSEAERYNLGQPHQKLNTQRTIRIAVRKPSAL